MRMIVVDQDTTGQALGMRLLGASAGKQGALDRIQKLNPHLDLAHIAAGTVLFVPDTPGLKDDPSTSIGGQAFDAFRDLVHAQLDAVVGQIAKGHEALSADRVEVQAALKGVALRRLIESNPDLKPQVDAATKVFKQDQQDAKDSQAQLKALREGVLGELAALGKLLQ